MARRPARPKEAKGAGAAPDPADAALRREIVEAGRRMNAVGINQGTSGNVSARTRDGFLITPTALPYSEMTPDDVVAMRMDGTHVGSRQPSTEWRFHRDILAARHDVTAIVHAHSMFATTLACLGRSIPAFHYMVAVAGGADVRCAPYATFGSQALADHAVAALEGRRACLLANHGMIAVGESLARALSVAMEIETLATMYWRALQLGEPALLSDAEMAVVVEKFRTYGAPPDASSRT